MRLLRRKKPTQINEKKKEIIYFEYK